MLAEGYTASDYKRHLKIFFEYLTRNGDIAEGCYQIRQYAGSVLKRIEKQEDDDNWSLMIGPWILPISNRDDNFGTRTACLTIDGKVNAKDSRIAELSFTIGIILNPPEEADKKTCCDNMNRDSYRIARMFRFEVGEGKKTSAEPCSHMHYGGLPHETLMQDPYHNCLEDWIEKPRIPLPPYDFVLLFELFLRQFHLGIRRKLFEETYWRNCIRKSERMILTKYYGKVDQYFADGKGTLLDSLCTSES